MQQRLLQFAKLLKFGSAAVMLLVGGWLAAARPAAAIPEAPTHAPEGAL